MEENHVKRPPEQTEGRGLGDPARPAEASAENSLEEALIKGRNEGVPKGGRDFSSLFRTVERSQLTREGQDSPAQPQGKPAADPEDPRDAERIRDLIDAWTMAEEEEAARAAEEERIRQAEKLRQKVARIALTVVSFGGLLSRWRADPNPGLRQALMDNVAMIDMTISSLTSHESVPRTLAVASRRTVQEAADRIEQLLPHERKRFWEESRLILVALVDVYLYASSGSVITAKIERWDGDLRQKVLGMQCDGRIIRDALGLVDIDS